MAQLDPLPSKIAMTAVVVSMSLLVGLIAAAIATD
jgi:multisubunit Na+/H+ antiporter MnhC subunit